MAQRGRPRKDQQEILEAPERGRNGTGAHGDLIKSQLAPVDVSIRELVDSADKSGKNIALSMETDDQSVSVRLEQADPRRGRHRKRLTLQIESD